MAHVKRIARGPSACVQVEGFLRLICIKNDIQVSLTEEYIASQEDVGLLPCKSLDPLKLLLLNFEAPVLVNEFVVVHALVSGFNLESGHFVCVDWRVVLRIVFGHYFRVFKNVR